MNTRLELVSDRCAAEPQHTADEPTAGKLSDLRSRTDAAETDHELVFRVHPRRRRTARVRELLGDERGAVTAEYAIVIMAAVAFAGLLVAIMRSDEIRAMLVQLVENALGTGG